MSGREPRGLRRGRATHQNRGDLMEDVDGLLRGGALIDGLLAGHCYIRDGAGVARWFCVAGGRLKVVGLRSGVDAFGGAWVCPAQIRIPCDMSDVG